MRRTKIVCTIGPASEDYNILRKLIEKGMNVARLNFSHGDFEEHGARIDNIKKIREEFGLPVAILLDTKGPEIRTGKFKNGGVELKEGQTFVITTRDVLGDETICSVSYKGLPQDVERGSRILIDDGLISLKVTDVKGEDIVCIVENSGPVKDHKGVNVPGVKLNLPALTQKDVDDIEFGIKKGIDIIAASFVRKAADVLAIRRLLEENKAEHILIIAKIENREGVENIDEIIKVSDGIMVARGDLGVEIPLEEIPIVQKMIIQKCNKAGKPVITATQMLDSMMRNPRPTRAEVTDVANAILDGTDAIMLSGETAQGKYPIEAFETMAKIAEKTEAYVGYRDIIDRNIDTNVSITNAISHATCTTARDIGAAAIITCTKSGYTARMVSRYRPQAPIIATTPSESVARKLSIVWGVYPLVTEEVSTTDEMIDVAIQSALTAGLIRNGDIVVISAGIPVAMTGTTNMLKVHIVGDVLLRGIGIGSKATTGVVCVINDISKDKDKFREGDIIVTAKTERDFMPLIEKASAIITEEGGLTSHAAIVGLNLGIPVVVGCEGATSKLKDGMTVTVDTVRGFVYKGIVNIK
ncbi:MULTISPECIES: pyruvate kinase [Thermoanaerobacter]|uniref:Pyruvate kinase n=2 Tax=Thermoanaerobacter TaxID=1754 RepID=B0K7U8_THEP3|nr:MULTISPECIES: pyruvate kinase [Thermoanaerobacter]ABY94347.1 Pyruvate kinase., Pyruvate, water dikinase [Thermoanaerobacter pseudethanolicus ATCC 33223]ADV79296.1 pyruvate kinase [Thermoanaerobacter brockii subsp. finnii Ako-1]HBW60103.1 pyruvate kinase [Thermoanaerobacter sp.]